MVTFAAPAKIILSGEHSVVYTKPAFVTAIDRYLTVSIEDGIHKDVNKTIDEAVTYCTDIVQKYIKKNTRIDIFPRFTYTYTSDIPEGRGMGSSAAFCVATVAALLYFYTNQEYDKQVINSLAYQCEKHFHGMPSGVDVSASCFGGLIFYRKEFEFLKTISALNFKLPVIIEERLFLIDTGKPEESTKVMVAYVGKKYNEDPQGMDQLLQQIEKVTKRMVVSVVKEDAEMFKTSLEENGKLLIDFHIVSEQTQQMMDELQPFGVGKITGAGGRSTGSGYLLFYTDKPEELRKYLEINGITYHKFKQNYSGVLKK